MKVFGDYARYYNLLYRDKDYAGEAGYVHDFIQKYRPAAKSILDLGCGTGGHAFPFAARGYEVAGVDISAEMIDVARARLSAHHVQSSALNLSFQQGDIRTVRMGRTFDAVVSLFHVMSYQTSHEDLAMAFRTAKEHLTPGGLFIFDCWYGPAVLTDRPAVRIKRLEDEEITVTRLAEPVMRPNDNIVEVHYEVFIGDKATGSVVSLKEIHAMRYLFVPEIESLMKCEGVALVHGEEWMTGREPGFDTWSCCFIGKCG
jgi:SAM-dependent methyltransferase